MVETDSPLCLQAVAKAHTQRRGSLENNQTTLVMAIGTEWKREGREDDNLRREQ